jgi:GPH family glycoside/pentoside/hexuronide:cation symporter
MDNDQKNKKQKKAKEKLPVKYTLGWSSRAVSLSVNFVLLMYLQYFCTNVLGIQPLLAGSVLLAVRVFDGFTDIAAGVLINKVRTRFGVVRHYELCIVPMWICTILLFSVPMGFSTTGRVAWVFVFYSLVNAVFATLLNSSDSVYMARSLPNQVVQAKVLSVNGLIIMVFSAVISIVVPGMMSSIGLVEGGWTKIAMIIGIPMAIIGMGRFFLVKELDSDQLEMPEPIKVGEGLRAVANNKYIFMVAGAALLCQMVSAIYGSVGTYYFEYIVGDLSMLGTMGLMGLVAPVSMLFFPILLRKIGAVNIARWGLGIGIVGYAVKIFAGANIPMLLVTGLISSVGILPFAMMINIYVIDCMTYGEWKNGKRADGFLSVLIQFASKVGTGLASGGIGVLMGMVGFDGTLATQSPAVLNMIVGLYSWIPAILLLVNLLVLWKYDLDKLMPKINEDLALRREKNLKDADTIEEE